MPIAAASGGGSSLFPLLMIALLFGLMYFMMIRPQQRRRKEAEQMQSALGPGDEVVTIGGMHGVVSEADDQIVTLEVATDVHVRFTRQAIARVLTTADRSQVDEEAAEEAAGEETADEVDDAAERVVDRGRKKD